MYDRDTEHENANKNELVKEFSLFSHKNGLFYLTSGTKVYDKSKLVHDLKASIKYKSQNSKAVKTNATKSNVSLRSKVKIPFKWG